MAMCARHPKSRSYITTQPPCVWVVDALEKVFADTAAPAVIGTTIRLEAAGGECEVAQIAVHASTTQLRLCLPEVTALASDHGQISLDCITCRFVELVPVRFPTQGVPADELIRMAPAYYPDPLCREDHMNVPAGQTRSIYVRIEVPSDAPPGQYHGTMRVKTSAGDATVDVELTVWPLCLPKHIPFAVTLWLWPAVLAKYHCVALYSEPFWTLLKEYAAEMAAHRQDTIFTPIIGPDSLIEVTKGAHGYEFGFTRFDRWVGIFLDAGFKRIEGAHLFDRFFKFQRVFDSATGNEMLVELGSTLQAFTRDRELMTLVSPLLVALRDHLRDRGWSDCYVQHLFDEPSGEHIPAYLELVERVRKVWPDVVLVEAGDADPSVRAAIDVLVPLIGSRSIFEQIPKYRQAGKTCWSYTCNFPRGRYPNIFLDYPLLKTRILPWILWRYGVGGFLYWALGYWENQHDVPRDRFDPYSGRLNASISLYNPWLDPVQNATWQVPPGSWGFVYPPRDPCAQDPCILAPKLVENFERVREGHPSDKDHELPRPERMKVPAGIVSSLRWEQLREGVEDYGLLCLLEQEIKEAGGDPQRRTAAKQAKADLDRIVQSVAADWQDYTRDPTALQSARRHVAQMLLKLKGEVTDVHAC